MKSQPLTAVPERPLDRMIRWCGIFVRHPLRFARRRLTGQDPRRFPFIACFPKSGSTYLMRLVCELTGFPKVLPVEARGAHEQDFSPRLVRALRYDDAVCHQHLKATANNLSLVIEQEIRVVVLVRNIFDIVISVDDHLHNEDRHFVPGYVGDRYFEMSDADRWFHLIHTHLPWYFNFLRSWDEAQRVTPVHWLTYEGLFTDQLASVSSVMRFWDLDVSGEAIERAVGAVANQNTRLNKGVAGRGAALAGYHRDRIVSMADACALSDRARSLIGLGPASGGGASEAAGESAERRGVEGSVR